MAGLIDYSIIKPELANALATGFQKAQDRQTQMAQQERQNKLADLQFRAAQRGEEDALMEREAYKNQDPLAALRAAGLGKQALAYQKTLDEQTAAKLKQATDIHKLVSDSLRGVAALGTRESAQGALANVKAAGLNVDQYETELAQTPDALISKWALSHAAGADKALEQQFVDLGFGTVAGPKYATGSPAAQPTAPSMGGMPAGIPGQTPGGRIAGTNALALPTPGGAKSVAQPYAVPGGGMMYPKGMSQAQTATDAREQQRIALEQRRVDLAEKEAARKESGLAELPPKEIQKREAILPQARLAVTTVGKTMGTIEETIDRLLANETGLNGITGLVYGNTPALTDAARKANADLGQLKNLAFVQGITELRAASKTGAGVGSVSDREGNRFENLKASLDRSQSLQDLKDSLVRLKSNAQFTKHSLQEAFDETYQYKQGKETAKPAAASAVSSNIDALLNKYK
jgi:hypothetical protein